MTSNLKRTRFVAQQLRLVSRDAHNKFVAKASALGLDPENTWIGGYVEYEWQHLRPILHAYGVAVAGKRVLEFGSNIGASAIVFAQLGAQVQAADVAADFVDLARCNALRYGVECIDFQHVPDTRSLPFATGSVDLVSCNSVLEYVHPDHLAAVQREIDRVLKPGGLILVTGTSSRLWPREVHSHAWLVNYIPRSIERLLPLKQPLTRGVWPWSIRHGFGPGYRNLDAEDRGRAFLAARAAMVPPKDGSAHRLIAAVARMTSVGPGMLMNNISCLLRKASG
jgi:SAM-dependent methyltransferase